MVDFSKKESMSKSLYLPVELIKKIDVIAVANDISFNQVAVRLMEFALENIDIDSMKSEE